jgi:hypothetical protein
VTIVLDATMLIMLFDEDAKAPLDPSTGESVAHCQERLRYFLNVHTKPKGSRVIVPTPALGEFLVKIKPESVAEFLSQLQRVRGCYIAPFSIKAAVEFAEMQRSALQERGRKSKGDTDSRAKAKFDQQIVAIAKVDGAQTIYTDDQGLSKFAKRFGIQTVGIAELPLPPETAQGTLDLEPLQATPEVDDYSEDDRPEPMPSSENPNPG